MKDIIEDIIDGLKEFKNNIDINTVLKNREDIINTPVEITDITQFIGIEGKYIESTPINKDGYYILIYRAKDRYILVCNNVYLFKQVMKTLL